MSTSEGTLRTARAAVFAALCVTLSAGAHVLLSAAPLPVLPLAAVAVGVFAAAWALAGRERRFGAIAALLVPLELFADTVFTAGQDTCYGHAAGPVAGPLRALGIDVLCAGGDVGAPLAHVSPVTSPWLLLAAHVTVGLAAAAWLRGGEAALVRLLEAAAASAFRPLRPALARLPRTPGPRRPARAETSEPALAQPLLVHAVLRRGPPRAYGLTA